MRRSTFTRDGVTMPSKTAAPVVKVAGVTLTDGIPTVVVTLRLREPKATARFHNFCRQTDQIGFQALDVDEDGNTVRPIYVCAGHPDRLEQLIRQDFVLEWQHDVNTRVCINAKSLAKEKVVDKTIVEKVHSHVRSKDGEVIAVKNSDVVVEDRQSHNELHHHQCETLDKAQQQATNAASQWWKERGLPIPIGNIGPDGKVL